MRGRRKPVPPAPESLDTVEEVRGAVPLVPAPETDCCARLMDRADVPARDEAKTWLTFLAALKLARESNRGWVRTRDPSLEVEVLAERFEANVYGARELLVTLEEEGPLDAEAAFERFREHVPRWERDRRPDEWPAVWRRRVRNLLDWAVLLEVAERVGTEFTVADGAGNS